MNHAMVPTGEYMVPLIGIKPSDVEEVCDVCGQSKHLLGILYDGERFTCLACRFVEAMRAGAWVMSKANK